MAWGLKVLSVVEAMRVKFRDAKYIAKEEFVGLGDCNITPNMKPGCWARMLGTMVVPFTGLKDHSWVWD